MRLVVGLEVFGDLEQVLDGLAGRWQGIRVRGSPAAKEALDGYAGVGGAEGELGEAPGARLLFEGVGEVVEFGI